jgi:hypothetical protein
MNFRFWDFQRSGPPADIELGRPQRDLINGFPSASAFIASDPDHAFSIYNAFHRLSSRSLLYLEAEIFELQKQQDDLDVRDSRGDPDTLQCFRSWKKLCTSSDPRQLEHMALIIKIRKKLKEYRKLLEIKRAVAVETIRSSVDVGIEEALVLQESVLKMGKPQSGTVEALKLWLDGESEGSDGRHAPSFSGLSAARLNTEEDLVALHPVFEKDWLTRLVELPYLRLLCLVRLLRCVMLQILI